MISARERARAAFERQAWGEALVELSTAGEHVRLDADDLARKAVCAYLVGEDDQCAEAWEAAHRTALDDGDAATAAYCAVWLALCLMLRGMTARAGAWLARAQRAVDEAGLECTAGGYLLIAELLGSLDQGDASTARDLALDAAAVAERFDDPDLWAFATLGHGQALVAAGDLAGGTARFDEVMLSVTEGAVGPITSGIVYCAVILECINLYDLRRAAEWTDALTAWCDHQPDLVPYRGQCLVHRSQLAQAAGRWQAAAAAAAAACERLCDPPHPALGLARYQAAELQRLSGELDAAERGYRDAQREGFDPMPGLALLQLARGDAPAAARSIRRALQERSQAWHPSVLMAAVEIFRASDDVGDARAAADELSAIATGSSSEVLDALAAQARGAVLVAEGDAADALAELREASAIWRSLHHPHDVARTGVLLGLACAALGDTSTAVLELDSARATFRDLGATLDLERLERLARAIASSNTARTRGEGPILSPREREVLGLVAEGRTNREIADGLVISEHTVSRHMENIFTKLGVGTRAAAIARAYETDQL